MTESTRCLPIAALASVTGFLALGAGAGLSPKAPGTVGTVLGVPLVMLMPDSLLGYTVVLVALAVVGVWLCDVCARDLGVHDHPGIVWDEIVGYAVTMTAAPRGWLPLLLGFVLFRLFDILKPWPIRVADRRVHGGLGIMLDDLLAGVLAAVCLQVLLVLVPSIASL